MRNVSTDTITQPFATAYIKSAFIENSAEALHSIVTSIIRLAGAEKLFLLKADANPYHLLALLPGHRPHTFRAYQRLVQRECSNVVLWCIHTGEAGRLLRQGHLFYTMACTPARLVYDAGRQPLPGRESGDTTAVVEKARTVFNRSFTLACAFLDGATYYAGTAQARAAAFNLHQAAEQALRALLLSIAGYNPYGHDLRGLLRRYELFGQAIFSCEEQPLLHQLNNAYMHTRYKPNYVINTDELALLLQKVAALHGQVQTCFAERVAAFEAFLLSG